MLKDRIVLGNENFQKKFIEMMTKMNYQIYDIDNLVLKEFINKYIQYSIGSSSFYRKSIIPKLFDQKWKFLQKIYLDKDFYLIADGSMNSQGRNVLCLIIVLCEQHKFSTKHFLSAFHLNDSTSQTYSNLIMNALKDFFGKNLDFSRFKLLITDQAPNMLKTGKILKEIATH